MENSSISIKNKLTDKSRQNAHMEEIQLDAPRSGLRLIKSTAPAGARAFVFIKLYTAPVLDSARPPASQRRKR